MDFAEERQRLAVIGGSGVTDFLPEEPGEVEIVPTPYGEALLIWKLYMGRRVVFVPRHGPGHRLPPHRVNYRANIWALDLVGVHSVLATGAVGSLVDDIDPGAVVFVDQFLDFTRNRSSTFFDGDDGRVLHTDVSVPYCPRIRQIAARTAAEMQMDHRPAGTYVCVEGPRYECPAEIRMFTMLGGHVVGMTNLPEAVLARELGLCYATVAVVTNKAAGLVAKPVNHEEVLDTMRRVTPTIDQFMARMMEQIDDDPTCPCRRGRDDE